MTAPTPAQTQREHDADDLVTEEMVTMATAAFHAVNRLQAADGIEASLRAVAPMIRREVLIPVNYAMKLAVEQERKACEHIARQHEEACRELGFKEAAGSAASIADAISSRELMS